MVKIIFSDFDYTMLDYYSGEKFNDYRIGVLKKLRDNNIKICIVTGRAISFFDQFGLLLKNIDYVISSNGSLIYDICNKKIIMSDLIDINSLDKIIGYAINNGEDFVLDCFNKRYKYGNKYDIDCDLYMPDIDYNSNQVILSGDKDKLNEVIDFLDSIDNIVVNNITSWREFFSIDINNREVSKGNSIKYLCDYLGIDYRDSVGIGDGENDISMLEVVGQSVAMGNASDYVKGHANDIALSCYEEGFYKYIEDKILR